MTLSARREQERMIRAWREGPWGALRNPIQSSYVAALIEQVDRENVRGNSSTALNQQLRRRA